MANASTLEDMSPGLVQGVERAQRDPAGRFHARAPLIDVPALARASHRQRADAAVGGDGVTQEQYGQRLEGTLQDRHARRKDTRYRPQPLRRVHLPKGEGTRRPMGIAACEDQLGQDAVREGLEALYEQDGVDCSHGFRPGRRAHGAVRPLQRLVERGEGRGSVEADIVLFFDRVDRTALKKRRGVRVAEGSLMRLLGKGVHVGGLDGEALDAPAWGTVQGAVLSPLLGNVYVHDVLDRWCATEGKPRLQGTATLRRSGDDCLIGFAREDDARRVAAVLDKRLGRCGLARHPAKTRLWPCWRLPKSQQHGKGPATCDFVGCTFDGARPRNGHWRMACKTRRASLRRAKKALYEWCRRHRQLSSKDQHAALHRRLRGPCNSFGVRGNSGSLRRLVEAPKRAW